MRLNDTEKKESRDFRFQRRCESDGATSAKNSIDSSNRQYFINIYRTISFFVQREETYFRKIRNFASKLN